MVGVGTGGFSTAATPFLSISRIVRFPLRLNWRWRININAMDNAEEMVFWCFDNFDKVEIDAKKHDDWRCVIPICASGFYYDKQVVTTLPFRIQIWIKDDEDATAFKLRWL